MAVQALPLVLGSASPRRLEIVTSLGLSVRVQPAQIDETPGRGEQPDAYVRRVTEEKLEAVRRALGPEPAAVLVADTIVTVDGEILGKPVDDQDARRMLGLLVGRTHQVVTCYALSTLSGEAGQDGSVLRAITTDVSMRAASDIELAAYVSSGECRDKAGAYAIQGIGAFLVESISGSYSNVVGLPICELVVDLKALRVLLEYP